jgi:TonB family protein
MILRYAILVLFACSAVAQDCRQSADPKHLLNELADLSRDRTPSDEAFHSVLPCTSEVVPLQTLLDALQYDLTTSQKMTIISYFHIQSPIRVEDVDAISRSPLPGELIDEMLLPMKYGDLKLDRDAFDLKPDVVSRLGQKHVSEETLIMLGVDLGSIPKQTATATLRIPTISPPAINADNSGDALSKAPSSDVSQLGGDVSQPVKLYTPEPRYSEDALRAKYWGTVLLSVIIDRNGNTRDIKVVRPLGLGLDEKAIEAVGKWRFRPAMKGGQPVAVRANIEVNFQLLDNTPRVGAAPKN